MYFNEHHAREIREIWKAIGLIERQIMSVQEAVDALTTVVQSQGQTIQQVATDAAAAQVAIQTEVDDLQKQIDAGVTPSLTKLQAAVADNSAALAPLDGAVQALGATVPTPPTPAPPTSEQPPASVPSGAPADSPPTPADPGAAPATPDVPAPVDPSAPQV